MSYSARSRILSRLAAAIVCLLFAALLGIRLPVLSLVLAIAAISFGYQAFKAWRPRSDPYDLKLLQEIHEEEELRSVRVPDETGDNVLCPRCGEVYTSALPMCPTCRRTCN